MKNEIDQSIEQLNQILDKLDLESLKSPEEQLRDI